MKLQMSDTRPTMRTMPSPINDVSSVCNKQLIKISGMEFLFVQ